MYLTSIFFLYFFIKFQTIKGHGEKEGPLNKFSVGIWWSNFSFDDGLLYTPVYRRQWDQHSNLTSGNMTLKDENVRPTIAILTLFFKRKTVSSVMRNPMMTFSELVGKWTTMN